jgi:uncharacterized membrane protein SpoIIM required for sporulation
MAGALASPDPPRYNPVMPQSAGRDFRQHLEIETPEHVVLDYEIAGVASRALAAIGDTAVIMLWLAASAYVLTQLFPSNSSWLAPVLGLVSFVTLWGYYTFFEGLRQGQTPGKRWLGLRVVLDTGHPVTLSAAAVRNLLRIADFLPPPYLLGTLLVALHPRGKRIGDLVAGTVVVRDHPVLTGPALLAADDRGSSGPQGTPELSDQEFHFLREYAERAPELEPAIRSGLARRLTERLSTRYPNRPDDPELFLAGLYRDELARRRGRFGGRLAGGGGVVDRLVARKSARWDEFQALAERAGRDGLDAFAAAELPDFAARYREVAADLARARTYRAAPAVQIRLERLVASGHNALYRDERRPAHRIWKFLIAECPASIVLAWRVVLVAFLCFALPAAGGYLLLRERPALAEEVLPATMLERAEAGVERQRQGRGYVEADPDDRPLMASRIMQNNIRVAFFCFGGGVFLGVGSLVLLSYNGLALGAISGHFGNAGLLGYLWTFVIGHGVLELFAIWVAGAAGFLLGRALIAPGDYRRADALTLAGRRALPMIGGVVVLLVLAGLIEGFVSASTMPLAYRLGVSSASVLFLLLYLGNGWRHAAVSHQTSDL